MSVSRVKCNAALKVPYLCTLEKLKGSGKDLKRRRGQKEKTGCSEEKNHLKETGCEDIYVWKGAYQKYEVVAQLGKKREVVGRWKRPYVSRLSHAMTF